VALIEKKGKQLNPPPVIKTNKVHCQSIKVNDSAVPFHSFFSLPPTHVRLSFLFWVPSCCCYREEDPGPVYIHRSGWWVDREAFYVSIDHDVKAPGYTIWGRGMEIDKREEGGKSRVANWITVSLSEQKPPERVRDFLFFRSLISFMCTILTLFCSYFWVSFPIYFFLLLFLLGEC
jgi:hypothetical protein